MKQLEEDFAEQDMWIDKLIAVEGQQTTAIMQIQDLLNAANIMPKECSEPGTPPSSEAVGDREDSSQVSSRAPPVPPRKSARTYEIPPKDSCAKRLDYDMVD